MTKICTLRFALIERERAQEQVEILKEQLVEESDKKKAAEAKAKKVGEAKKKQEDELAEKLNQVTERA